MKITQIEFMTSARKLSDCPDAAHPDICFAGRSNVGKSSLINALLKRRQVARVSATPGKTRGINFFLINGSFHFVDLPGYGFAKVPREERNYWGKMMREYFEDSRRRKLVIVVIDLRREPSPLDLEMKGWLEFAAVPHLIAATKADKLTANSRSKNIRVLASAYRGCPIVPFSAKTSLGVGDVWGKISGFLEQSQQMN